jgi:hypothetical protein
MSCLPPYLPPDVRKKAIEGVRMNAQTAMVRWSRTVSFEVYPGMKSTTSSPGSYSAAADAKFEQTVVPAVE